MNKTQDLPSLKKASYDYCKGFVANRIGRIQTQIQGLELALNSETKSSAGDKHETGRAMIQLEREKLGQQLSEIEKTQLLLSKVPLDNHASNISLGNLVITNNAFYYLAISAGAFKSNHGIVYCISIATPIGKLLLGKTIGTTVSFNGNSITIDTIL